MNPEAIIERLWPGQHARFEPLGGGITNHNYKIEVEGDTVVLRIGGKDTELLGIDRRAEEAAARMAASVGVGPEVVTVVQPEGYLVTRFIEGRPVPLEAMQRPETLTAVADSVRAIHNGSPLPSRFNAHRVVEAYAATGRQPFGSGTFQTIFFRVLEGKPDVAGIPSQLLPFVNAALSTDPQSRPSARCSGARCRTCAPRRGFSTAP